jgi:hypothetical protein
MRENITYRKGPYDEILIKVLREHPYKYEDFRKKCVKEFNVPYQTFRRRFLKLIELGLIEYIDEVKITRRFEEANRNEVQDCLNTILEKENIEIIKNRMIQLRILSQGKRIAHLPGVIFAFEKCTKNPHIIKNNEIFEEMMRTLQNILSFEQENISPDSNKIIDEILSDTFQQTIRIINQTPHFPGHYSLGFLGKSGKREAVDLIFQKILAYPSELESRELKDILFYSLGRDGLYQSQHKTINKCLDELLLSGDKRLIEISTKIRERINFTK